MILYPTKSKTEQNVVNIKKLIIFLLDTSGKDSLTTAHLITYVMYVKEG
jgi:hypothetical protein